MAGPARWSRHRGKGGEGGRGSPPNFFFQPFRPQFGVNIRGGPPLDPPLISTLKLKMLSWMVVYSLHLILWYFIKQWRLAKHRTPWPQSIKNMWRGEKKGGRLDPLPKIFGSALANQIVNLAVIFQIIICVNDLHNSPGSKEKKKDLPVPLYLLCKILYEMLLTCKDNPSVLDYWTQFFQAPQYSLSFL